VLHLRQKLCRPILVKVSPSNPRHRKTDPMRVLQQKFQQTESPRGSRACSARQYPRLRLLTVRKEVQDSGSSRKSRQETFRREAIRMFRLRGQIPAQSFPDCSHEKPCRIKTVLLRSLRENVPGAVHVESPLSSTHGGQAVPLRSL